MMSSDFPYYKNIYEFSASRFKQLVDEFKSDILTYNPSTFDLETFDDGKYFILRENWDKNAELNNITDCFTEEARIQCQFRGNESPAEYWQRNFAAYEGKTPMDIREKLYIDAHYCNNFRISVAISVLRHFQEIFGPRMSWLDISAGWGDRLLAAIACRVEYMAADPNPALHAGYNKIRSSLNSPEFRGQYIIEQNGFEHLQLRKKYDLVFTSPPFFDLEIYSNDSKDSLKANPTASEWYHRFLVPSLHKAYTHLNDGGYMVLYIAESTSKRKDSEKYNTTNYVSSMRVFLDCLMQYRGSIYYYYEPARNKAAFRQFFVWKKIPLGFTQAIIPRHDPPSLGVDYTRFKKMMGFVDRYPRNTHQCIVYYIMSILITQNKFISFDDTLYHHFCTDISPADFKLFAEDVSKLDTGPDEFKKTETTESISFFIGDHRFDLPRSAYEVAAAKYINGLRGNVDTAILQCLIRYNILHYGHYKPRVIEYWGHECYGDIFDTVHSTSRNIKSYTGVFYDLERDFCSAGSFTSLSIKTGTYSIRMHPRFWGTGLMKKIQQHASRSPSANFLYRTTTLAEFSGGFTIDREVSGKKDRYHISSRPPVPVFCSFLNIEFPNPPPKQIKYGAVTVLDDSDFYGGTKERAMGEFLLSVIDVRNAHIHFPAASNGLGMVALTRAVNLLRKSGLNITAHIYSNGIMSSSIAYCKDNGAVMHFYPNKPLREIYPLITANVEQTPGGVEVSLGGDNPVYIEIFATKLQRLNLCAGLTEVNMWLVYGSGTIYAAMQRAYPQFTFHLVVVGRKPGVIRPQDKVYVAPQTFYELADVKPPYKTELTYDGKIWQFVLKHQMNNVFVWNVGYLPKLREKKYSQYKF